MEDLICPTCGHACWQTDILRTRCLCMKCGGTFELTKVNHWYKGTALEDKNMEFDKNNVSS